MENMVVLRSDDTKENIALISSIALDFGMFVELSSCGQFYKVCIQSNGITFIVAKKQLIAQLNWALYNKRQSLH